MADNDHRVDGHDNGPGAVLPVETAHASIQDNAHDASAHPSVQANAHDPASRSSVPNHIPDVPAPTSHPAAESAGIAVSTPEPAPGASAVLAESTAGPGATLADATHALPAPLTTQAPSTPESAPFAAFDPASLPPYALQYCPVIFLHTTEQFWPGNVLLHIQHCKPETSKGVPIDIPDDIKGKCAMLAHPDVNNTNVFLAHTSDPRKNNAKKIDALTSTSGKPDPKTRKSDSICFIVTVDKTTEIEAGVVDVFYFLFYPYNYGNFVAFTHFGNHVGDWEHVMIRFHNGEPRAMHLSAHADGHAWQWGAFEKIDDRPVVYSASGSHANYPRAGTHPYSGIPLGPRDFTSRGALWDPSLNYVGLSYDRPSGSFRAHNLSVPTATPFPNLDGVVQLMSYKGHWGNAFSDYRTPRPSRLFPKIGQKIAIAAAQRAKEKSEREVKGSLSLSQRFNSVVWGEGPTGPVDKSLDRRGMNRWSDVVLDKC